jgi:hypothetical protein
MRVSVDSQWVKTGDPESPVMVRNVRTRGGMIVGRVTRSSKETRFGAMEFKMGQWREIAHDYPTFEDAVMALEKL